MEYNSKMSDTIEESLTITFSQIDERKIITKDNFLNFTPFLEPNEL